MRGWWATTANLEIVPDILESVEVEGRARLHVEAAQRPPLVRRPAVHHRGFPLLLGGRRQQQGALARPGRRATCWSNGETPKVEFPDEHTVRYTWSKPNPDFLPRMAGASPLFIYRPAHYLKQFHSKYTDEGRARPRPTGTASAAGRRCTTARTTCTSSTTRTLPTLQPWMNTTQAAGRPLRLRAQSVFPPRRPDGRQLPYIDRVVHGGGRGQADPGQDRRRRSPTCRRATCSSTTTPS